MPDLYPYLTSLPFSDLGGTVIFILILSVARYLALRLVRSKAEDQPQLQRRWMRTVRNTYWLLLIIGMSLLWAPQLRTFALSVTAIAVAIVIATKELILCFSGSFMRASSRAFNLGDWIEVGGIAGEVTDHNIFSTTLHELDAHGRLTGQEIIFPNSLLLTTPVRNHSLTRAYIMHSFSVVTEPQPHWLSVQPRVQEIVARHFEPLREAAERERARLVRRTGLMLDPELVKVRYATTDTGNYITRVKLFCPAREAGRLESAITFDLLQLYGAAGDEAEPEAATPAGQ